MIENHFVIITPVYNAEAFIEKSIRSVLDQTYKNFSLVVVDDCSTDKTTEIITEIQKQNTTLHHCRKEKRIGSPLHSFVMGIDFLKGKKEDILITVDGDDWFADNNVLEYMNGVYQDPDVWLTYGQFKSVSGKLNGYCRPVTNTRTYRKGQWTTGHLRTLKRGLFDKIDRKDFLQKNGNFYNKYNDTAYMFPAIEMAGLKHIHFIDKILYVYNDQNPLCSIVDFDNAYLNADWDMGADIKNKTPYKEIKEL